MILPVIFSAASLVLCGFFFVYFRSWLGNRMGREEKLARYREEVNRLIIAIDTATDRDAAVAEDRIQTLKNLIVEADEKIAVMLREREKQKNRSILASESYAALGRGRLSGETVAAPETAEPAVLPETAAPSRSTAGAEGRQSETAEIPPASRPFAEEVTELAARGFSADLIAQKLEASLSEVDLVLKIREGQSAERRSF
ncbi:MAG: hypothetical protein LBS06_06185 [Treponema sp.]|jgi:hypothetical protein|nr:hypothetical protein [Treponema sp.]